MHLPSDVFMYTGHQCKVDELEYGDLLVEACLVVNGETEIHRYSYETRCPYCVNYIHGHTYRVTWIQLQGTKYVEGCVVVLDSSEVLPTFGLIINVLLIKPDKPYFACELLQTKEFSTQCFVNQMKYVIIIL